MKVYILFATVFLVLFGSAIESIPLALVGFGGLILLGGLFAILGSRREKSAAIQRNQPPTIYRKK